MTKIFISIYLSQESIVYLNYIKFGIMIDLLEFKNPIKEGETIGPFECHTINKEFHCESLEYFY